MTRVYNNECKEVTKNTGEIVKCTFPVLPRYKRCNVIRLHLWVLPVFIVVAQTLH